VDTKQIKELMSAMEESGVTKMVLKEKAGFELQLERHVPISESTLVPAPSMHFYRHSERHHEFPHVQQGALPHVEDKKTEHAVEQKQEGVYITSPMVGTFYTASSPEHMPFVKVGDTVHEGMVVCIIEAMKVMNEVKATKGGTIAEVCMDNGHPVEFGTRLFRIV